VEIDDLQKLWSRVRREPRRVLPWLVLAVVLGLAASLLNEGVRRLVFPEKAPEPTRVLEARFAQVLREQTDLAEALGLPVADPVTCGATVQPFESGFMLWTSEQPDSLFACTNNVERSCQQYVHVSLSRAEQNAFDSQAAGVRTLFNPTGGFRTAWIHNGLNNTLGLPLVAEKGLQVVVQHFERGFLVRDVPWFRRADNQFLPLPDTQPVLSLQSTRTNRYSWSYHGKYGA